MKIAPAAPDFFSIDHIVSWLRENASMDMALVGEYTMFDLCRDLEDMDSSAGFGCEDCE